MAYKPQIEIVRAANTTAYSAGQVINNNGSTSPINIFISESLLLGGQAVSSNSAGTPSIAVHMFSVSPIVAADGSAFDPSNLVAKNGYLGTCIFDQWVACANIKLGATTPSDRSPFKVPSGVIYCVVVANSAYTPISAEDLTFQFDFA